MLDRRSLLAALSAAATTPAWAVDPPKGLVFGPAKAFGLSQLQGYAKKLASQPYKAPYRPPAELLRRVNYDSVQKIHFRSEAALWHGAATYPVAFFHMANYSGEPVTIHAVRDGVAREILYSPDYFDYGTSGVDPRPLAKLGFPGFRVMDSQTAPTDWLAFQGASYFRSSGEDAQYGASARGIAINTALQSVEEFPRFSQFWLEENGPVITIYALLEGPSVTGAYKFDTVKHGGTVMNVHCDLYFRADITRLGVAPLTSMYWYGENQRDKASDWRPEVHDNDGLAIANGRGERVWRPLINPPQIQTNSFMDENPKGFGLMQRDRLFDDYQDDSAFYNKRPSIWIEPKGKWGKGAVQLVEIPTADEIHDNIVVYWRPDAPVASGDSLSFDYRLTWQDDEPAFPKTLARVVATRIGRGSGAASNIGAGNRRRFVVDFQGGALSAMAPRFDITPVLDTSSGKIDGAFVIKVVGTDRWRAEFDLLPDPAVDGKKPVDMRCFLRLGNKVLSETWIYQYFA
jgi:glucans biosynthesis protein